MMKDTIFKGGRKGLYRNKKERGGSKNRAIVLKTAGAHLVVVRANGKKGCKRMAGTTALGCSAAGRFLQGRITGPPAGGKLKSTKEGRAREHSGGGIDPLCHRASSRKSQHASRMKEGQTRGGRKRKGEGGHPIPARHLFEKFQMKCAHGVFGLGRGGGRGREARENL